MDPRIVFCPNMNCAARGKTGKGNIVIHSRKEARNKCTVCQKTFSSRKGTPFYRLHHSADLMVIVATLIAYGCPLQAIVVAYQLDERTVMSWQKRTGEHCRRVHQHLVQHPWDLVHVQADELRIKIQGQVLWLASVIHVSTRLWLGAIVGPQRDEKLIRQAMELIRACALARPLLICVDGLAAYIHCIQLAFRSGVPAKTKAFLVPWPDILIGQVMKQYLGKRMMAISRQMMQGSEAAAKLLLARSRGGTKLNTAFIERLNATFRSRLASLARRSRCLLRDPETLAPLVYLMGCAYNFCTEQKSLRLKLFVGSHGYRWVRRTPAMAAGIADHCWSVKELFLFQIPLPAWRPTHQGRPTKVEKELHKRWAL